MDEHTPGPWGLEGTAEFGFAIRGTAPGRPIADNVTTLANARLMAAAPTILEALRACAGYAGAGLLSNTHGKAIKLQQVKDTALAAIAKAALVAASEPFPHRES